METERKITAGELKVKEGVDAMTVVFGPEKRGSVRGVGVGVKSSKYFYAPPRNRGSAKQELKELQSVLREAQIKDEKVRALEEIVAKQDAFMKSMLAKLAEQGIETPSFEGQVSESLLTSFFFDK
jgi:hypothetical protein